MMIECFSSSGQLFCILLLPCRYDIVILVVTYIPRPQFFFFFLLLLFFLLDISHSFVVVFLVLYLCARWMWVERKGKRSVFGFGSCKDIIQLSYIYAYVSSFNVLILYQLYLLR